MAEGQYFYYGLDALKEIRARRGLDQITTIV